ncbi:family 1 glycosylhydrolase [Mycolicibacterium sp.]|uniref:family 1 glycosylhydrolase n=1 Tax=Mycolicibacterium sp. TaxID=2320850 RepID=UPI003D113578
MDTAHCIGRVGSLAVALGVGAALLTGSGLAWATEEPGAGTSSGSVTESAGAARSDDAAGGTEEADEPDETDEADPDDGDAADPDAVDGDDESADPDEDGDAEPEPGDGGEEDVVDDTGDTGTDDTGTDDTATDDTDSGESGDDESVASEDVVRRDETRRPDTPASVERDPSTADTTAAGADPVVTDTAATQQVSRTAAVPTAVVAPKTPAVPSWRPWSTAYDLRDAVTYTVNLISSVVREILRPFAAGPPAPPADPSGWALLAWVRREFFNGTPAPVANPLPYTQSRAVDGDVLITGNVGVSDPDGDALTYTLVGRPLNGGTVQIDGNGNFVYRPLNAMAAVGGVDTFTVMISDEHEGLHVHGLAGLLQFVPIIGSFLHPGGGHGITRTITVTVDAVDDIDLSLPDGFHWGVAHSGFQAEGGPNSPVDTRSDWYRWVHNPINQLLGLVKGVPENGPGAYVSYAGDALLARDELGMNTFRMSVEWSRIFPNSTATVDISDDGGGVTLADLQALDALADQNEVAHYRAVFEALRGVGLDPFVTVNHFTLPVWVHDPITAGPLLRLGLPVPAAGWLSSSTAAEFEKYAAYLAWKYGDQVDNWATLNEPFPPVLTEFLAIPGVVPNWPPGVVRPDLASTFLVNQAIGHAAAYDAIHRWDPTAVVGFTHNMIPARPANPVNPLDVAAADAWNHFYNGWFPNAVIDGWVDVNFDGVKTADEIFPEMADKADFLGVQYYGSQPMVGFGFAPINGFPFLRGFPIRCAAAEPTCSDFNQPTDPGGFREVLELAASYGKPLWVTENGIADAGDTKRPSYLVNHIAVVQDLVAHGTDIRGYTYWSFVDNLEWVEGYDLQFGLYGSDPTTPELERIPKPASIAAISVITKSNALPPELLAQFVPDAP